MYWLRHCVCLLLCTLLVVCGSSTARAEQLISDTEDDIMLMSELPTSDYYVATANADGSVLLTNFVASVAQQQRTGGGAFRSPSAVSGQYRTFSYSDGVTYGYNTWSVPSTDYSWVNVSYIIPIPTISAGQSFTAYIKLVPFTGSTGSEVKYTGSLTGRMRIALLSPQLGIVASQDTDTFGGFTATFSPSDSATFLYVTAAVYTGASFSDVDFSTLLLAFDSTNSSASYEEVEVGLLKSILQFLQSILTKIGDGFSSVVSAVSSGLANVVSAVQNVLQTLQELPEQFLDMLQTLFIPDDLSFVIDDFKAILQARLGVLYTIFDFAYDILQAFVTTTEGTTVYFPGISLTILGATFEMPAGYVEVYPSGLEGIHDTVRLVLTSLIFAAWFNGLLLKMSQFLSGFDGGVD